MRPEAGSRGDVARFAGLGQRCGKRGHQLAVAAREPFAGLVRGCGLEHRPLPGDLHEFVRTGCAPRRQK